MLRPDLLVKLVSSTILLSALITACSSTEVLNQENADRAAVKPETIVNEIPDYTRELHSVEGKGRAIVSEPNNSERVTVIFSSNKMKSLVKIKNNLGIEGGQMLADSDSLWIYNKVDKYLKRISIREGELSSLDHLATVNILDMLNYTFKTGDVENILEQENLYILRLSGGRTVYVDKDEWVVKQVDQPQSSGLPWSRIIYDGYADINGFTLPRRVTIFSADKQSKVALLIRSLHINPDSVKLTMDIPENIRVIR